MKKTSDTSHYRNVPFEVPESWVWQRILDISNSIQYGYTGSAISEGEYKMLRITDIQDNSVDWENVPFVKIDDKKAKNYLLANNDIVFARTGATVGKSFLIKDLKNESVFASYLIRIQLKEKLNAQYVKYFFESGYYWEQIEDKSVGTGQPNVNGTLLGELQIPLPPLAEQRRIVSKIGECFVLIDQIEEKKLSLTQFIKQTKSKVLDLAIRGKLVPQNPNDEPASVLLEQSKKEH
ncbi:MAG: restriction endonuclease subunit S, partial [Bacteroidales bacterium]|nr:restriction endonuclease subunit S [Bacteroidales bacterium]